MYNRIHENISLAWDIGLNVPDLQLKKAGEIIDLDTWEADPSGQVYFKKIQGPVMTYSQFWDKNKFRCYTCMVNDRALLNGGQGVALSSNCITAFAGPPVPIMQHLDKLAEILSEKDYYGFVTIEVTLAGGKPWYKHIELGTGYDYLQAMSALNEIEDVDDLVRQVESGEEMEKPSGFGATMRLYSYPYNITENVALFHTLAEAGLEIKRGDEGPILASHGPTIKKTWARMYAQIPPKINELACWRCDGDVLARRTYNTLMREHYHNEKVDNNRHL